MKTSTRLLTQNNEKILGQNTLRKQEVVAENQKFHTNKMRTYASAWTPVVNKPANEQVVPWINVNWPYLFISLYLFLFVFYLFGFNGTPCKSTFTSRFHPCGGHLLICTACALLSEYMYLFVCCRYSMKEEILFPIGYVASFLHQ